MHKNARQRAKEKDTYSYRYKYSSISDPVIWAPILFHSSFCLYIFVPHDCPGCSDKFIFSSSQWLPKEVPGNFSMPARLSPLIGHGKILQFTLSGVYLFWIPFRPARRQTASARWGLAADRITQSVIPLFDAGI